MNGTKHVTEAAGFVSGPLSVVSSKEPQGFLATDYGLRTTDWIGRRALQ